jgi:hypothetical protein
MIAQDTVLVQLVRLVERAYPPHRRPHDTAEGPPSTPMGCS